MRARRMVMTALVVMSIGWWLGATVAQSAVATPWDERGTVIQSKMQGSKGVMAAGMTAVMAPGDPVSISAALVKASNYLKKMQADVTEDNAGNGSGGTESPNDPDDGGWDWSLTSPPAPFFHTTTASPKNLYGVTTLGLYYGYLQTNDASYFTAMTDAANKMIADAGIRSASDLLFLMLYNDLPGVAGTAYKDAAKAKFDGRIAVYGSADSLAKYIRNMRGVIQGYPNGIIGWDIGTYVKAAAMLEVRYPADPYDYATAADDMAEVLWQDSFNDTPGYFDVVDDAGWDPDWLNVNYLWYTLGVSGLIEAFTSSNTHMDEVPGLAARLVASQFSTGAISGSYGAHATDEDWQSTAYAAPALAAVNLPLYQGKINHMAYWIGATQDVSGGWLYSDNSHYPEIGGECAVALALGLAPSYVIVDDGFTGQAAVDVYNTANGTDYVFGYDAFGTIQGGIDAVSGSTVMVLPGTYVLSSTVNLNKANLTIDGAGAGSTIVQVAQAVGYAFNISATGVTLRDIELQKTDVTGEHNLIYIGASNASILNNLIYGPDPGTPWSVNGIVSRAMLTTGGLTGLLIDNNTIHHLRQPAYFSGPTTGVISNNMVSGTRGWVNEGAQLTFTNNSWPLPANQGAEIALLAYAVNPAWYPDLIGLSNANNNAYIDAQFVGGDKGRAISYVNASAPSGGFGSILAPVQTILAGISGALATGTVQVATGNYPEYNLLINKPLTILGTGLPTIDATNLTLFPASALYVVNITNTSGNVTLDGFKIKVGEHNGIGVNAPNPLSVVTITHNELIGSGVNTEVGSGIGYGLKIGWTYIKPQSKVVFNYNQVSDFYNNSIIAWMQRGATEVMHNDFFHTYYSLFMTYDGADVTTLQKVAFNTFDLSDAGGNFGVVFSSATKSAGPPYDKVGKFTNVEISDNTFNGVGDDCLAISLNNDNNNNGTDGEIDAPRILRNKINGTGSVTNCLGIQLRGYVTDAVVEDNVISGVQVGIKLWNGTYSTTFYPVWAALTDNIFRYNQTGLLNMLGSLSALSNTFFNNTTNASDNKPGNTYDQNCWSDWSGAGTYAIGGGGGNIDANPNVDCGLDMTPNSIVYRCSGDFGFTVGIGDAVLDLEGAHLVIEYPAELALSSVTKASDNYTLFYSLTDNPTGNDVLTIDLGVMTGSEDGPATLFTVALSGGTSICTGAQITMTSASLRDGNNQPIIAPMASPVSLVVDCADPTIVVNSPASGGFYNVVPVLSISAADNCGLDAVYYQIDGCAPGGWLPIVTGLTGTTYSNSTWAVPGFAVLSQASHCIRFKVTDDNARGNADSCSFTWCFTKDVTAPPAPTNLVATPGHNKVHLSWTNATSDFNHVVVMRSDWYSGGHEYPEYDDNNAEGPYPSDTSSFDRVYAGTASTRIDTDDLSNSTRDVYHYQAFTVDAAGNVSAPSNQARSTSYWLGDINAGLAYDGFIWSQDLFVFAPTYGKSHGQPGYKNEVDFGPTYNMSPKGIPTTDNVIDFEDLVIFAINFDAVVPLGKIAPIFAGSDSPSLITGVLSLSLMMPPATPAAGENFTIKVMMTNNPNAAKAVHFTLPYDGKRLAFVEASMSPELRKASLPVFFDARESDNVVDISLALLGGETAIGGSGEIASVTFKLIESGGVALDFDEADVRDCANVRLDVTLHGAQLASVSQLPKIYALGQNYPNPFNAGTQIVYQLRERGAVSLTIYNITGQLVKTLVNTEQEPGTYTIRWNGRADTGKEIATGVYFYRMVAGDYLATKKMLIIK